MEEFKNWEDEVTWVGPIPFHPTATRSVYDCMTSEAESFTYFQERFKSAYGYRLPNIFMLAIFILCFRISIRLLIERPRVLAIWACVVDSTGGIIYNTIAISSLFPGGATCQVVGWSSSIGANIGEICISLVLLQKAYLVHNRAGWILAFAPFAVLFPTTIIALVLLGPVVQLPTCHCNSILHPYFPWIRLALHTPLNILFSFIFIVTVYRHFQEHGAEAWKKLGEEGLKTIVALLATNLVALIILTTRMLGPSTMMVLPMDW
jgi:hypothetical protein